MSVQWEEIMWAEEVLNWIPTKHVPEWLNELTGTQFYWPLGNTSRSSQEGNEILICASLLPGLLHFLMHIFSWRICEKSSGLSLC